jgi:opacity protein-like surface antigen
MKPRQVVMTLILSTLCSAPAFGDREPGWDFGGELLWQDAQDVGFEGGSSAAIDDDLGIALTFGYRFNSRLELIFGLDWNEVDYDFEVIEDSPLPGVQGFSGTGDLETWTPRVGVNFNFMETDLTPFVTAGVGWAFIDTNIPDAPPQTSCWWDPWYGYWCGTFQSTRSIDELTYNAGLGARWDVGDTITLRLAYEKHWIDVESASSTPDFDQLKFGVSARY